MTGPTIEPSLPGRLGDLPGRDAVGRAYALYDCERGVEVYGIVVAYWPERGPTWAVRLHELDPERRLVMVCSYERPESRHGRRFILCPS
jgi:hypothetical protein